MAARLTARACCAPFSPEQKWSKGKVKDKAANLVLFDEEVG